MSKQLKVKKSKQIKVSKSKHTGKSKAKTKKQMKKSINSLYTSLQEEKAKHAKASNIVGRHKQSIHTMANMIKDLGCTIIHAQKEIEQLKYDKVHTTEVTAGLVKEIANS